MFSTWQQLHNFSLLLGSTCTLFRAQLQHQFQVCLLQPVTLLKAIHLVKFSNVSKVIRDCIGFALLRSVIGPENSRHSLN